MTFKKFQLKIQESLNLIAEWMQRFSFIFFYILWLASDNITKRLQLWLNNPQCGHKEEQKFPIFWWENHFGKFTHILFQGSSFLIKLILQLLKQTVNNHSLNRCHPCYRVLWINPAANITFSVITLQTTGIWTVNPNVGRWLSS